MSSNDINDLLPLSPRAFYVLLSLAREETHGYAIAKTVAEFDRGSVRLTPGTLYPIVRQMLVNGWIPELPRMASIRAAGATGFRRAVGASPARRPRVSTTWCAWRAISSCFRGARRERLGLVRSRVARLSRRLSGRVSRSNSRRSRRSGLRRLASRVRYRRDGPGDARRDAGARRRLRHPPLAPAPALGCGRRRLVCSWHRRERRGLHRAGRGAHQTAALSERGASGGHRGSRSTRRRRQRALDSRPFRSAREHDGVRGDCRRSARFGRADRQRQAARDLRHGRELELLLAARIEATTRPFLHAGRRARRRASRDRLGTSLAHAVRRRSTRDRQEHRLRRHSDRDRRGGAGSARARARRRIAGS